MRIAEDIKNNSKCKIVTLTFNTESLIKLAKECKGYTGYNLDNAICKLAVKRFRERWRKKYKRSPRHWFITELGHGEWEHVHMHGIIWEDERYELSEQSTNKKNKIYGKLLNETERIWQYGNVHKGNIDVISGKLKNYVNEITANYFTKYVNKIDEQHKEYKQIILSSPGIGKDFLTSHKAKDNAYKGKDTKQMYQIDGGGQLPMPEYFRRKLYTDDEREQLTSWYLDKEIIYIDGQEVSTKIGDIEINKLYIRARQKNERLGYGKKRKNYEQIIMENARRRKLHKKRFNKK